MSIEEAETWLRENHKDFITSIVEEKYSVKKILKVKIEKSDGGTRTLEIPTVIDHIVQQCMYQTLKALYDRHFSESSQGRHIKR